MNKLKRSLPEPVLKAIYAGWKYHLSLEVSMGGLPKGIPDTASNLRLITQHYEAWKLHTKESIVLLEKED